MRTLGFVIGAAVCAAAALNAQLPGDSALPQVGALILDHINVVDVERGVIRRDMRVVIRDGRIQAVESGRLPLRADQGDKVVVEKGKFLIPGLWDMHVHIDTTEAWFFPLAIAAGVTSVRDMGSALSRSRAWKESRRPGELRPTVIASGPIVTGPVADTDSRLVRVSSPDSGRRAVDTLLERGVDFIKVHDFLDRETYLAMGAEAQSRYSYLAGHLPIAADPSDAVAAHQRSIEHMGNGWSSLLLFASRDRSLNRDVREWARTATGPGDVMKHFDGPWQSRLAVSFSSARAADLCKVLANGGVALTPTTYFSAFLTLMPLDSSILRDPRLQYLPRSVRDLTQYVVPVERFAPAARKSASIRVYSARAQLLRICDDEGVLILAGTDTGPYGPMIPGFSLHDELVRLVADGVSPMNALRAATINPAKFLRRLRSTGTIAAGNTADLVVLDANPVVDIHNVSRIDAVILGGVLIDREHRQRMLDSLATAFR